MNERIHIEVEGGTEPQPARRRGSGGVIGVLFWLPGLCFIAFGVALIVWPKLLVYLVSAVFMLIGLGLLVAGRKIGKARANVAAFRSQFTGPPR
ncbi:MAG: hypothetical protein QNJ90_08010 [Planctomycetota bacterium]|nr:hypothetical protein [Planctomycetota bacterium]